MVEDKMSNILFIAWNNMGNEFTGGDRIWIELMKRWKNVTLCGCREAIDLYNDVRGKKVSPTLWNITRNTIIKTFKGLKSLPTAKFDYIYSTSDFYPDLLPALLYKHHHPTTKWLAAYYLIAPPSFSTTTPYKQSFALVFKGFLYWLMQRVSLWLVNRYADVVMITSEPDKRYFPNKKVVVVRGGVTRFGERNKVHKYDAIYIGRFHYQKGVVELINMWRELQSIMPKARLCMIGDGPLLGECADLAHGLNIEFVGYQNNEYKYELIKQSKIVLHPATYDSGGMACAEAMAFGLPAVGFNLPAFHTYYPKGMLRVKNKESFINAIIQLSYDNYLYHSTSVDAYTLVYKHWNWDNRAKEIWECIQKSV